MNNILEYSLVNYPKTYNKLHMFFITFYKKNFYLFYNFKDTITNRMNYNAKIIIFIM